MIRSFIAVLLLAIAAPAMAIPYTNTVTFAGPGNLLPGQSTGTYVWSNPITDLGFQIPYDTINSATLTIQSRRSNGGNDIVSLSGLGVLGALNSAGGNNIATTTFDLFALNFFQPGWTTGQPLNLSLAYNTVGQNQVLTMVNAALTFDYTDGTPPPVPEPATVLLVGIGLAGGSLVRRRFKRQS